MDWQELWDKLLKSGVGSKIKEMNIVDEANGHTAYIEEVCHNIFDDYDNIKSALDKTKEDILRKIGKMPGVHLHTSRVKSIDSLIEKIITKRYDRMFDEDSGYANISADTYKGVVTDLVGLRIIINYRGRWLEMHRQILEEFPYDSMEDYREGEIIPLRDDANIQAEIPKVYYAFGDDVHSYIEQGLIVKQHRMNYRGIHYTVMYNGYYVEIQMRTIYDEAWSDCDHSYVYKKNDNKSHEALQKLSIILSRLTNLSNDIGDKMKDIYDEQLIENNSDGWICSNDLVDELDAISKRMSDICGDIKTFKDKVTAK